MYRKLITPQKGTGFACTIKILHASEVDESKQSMNYRKNSNNFLIFSLEQQQYALHLSAVESVVRAVEITRLPKAPEIVMGLVNVRGSIFPVVNTRRRFSLPEREIEPSDRYILARTSRRIVVLAVDAVEGVIEPSEQEVIQAETIASGLHQIEGVIKLESGILLIYDLEKFFSLEEEATLDRALEEVDTKSR